jgi:hypothetical protein
MRAWAACVFIVAGGVVWAESAATRQARERLGEVQALAQQGAASRKQVQQAEQALADAQDDDRVADLIDARVSLEEFAARVSLEELTEEQSAEMTQAARRRLERAQTRLAGHAQLVAEGVVPRTSLAPFEEDVARARNVIAAAEERARSLAEIAAMIRAEEESAAVETAPSIADGAIARITHFKGDAKFGDSEFKQVVLAFEKKFDRKLPVSARGETALHRSMGFDHRGRVDVAMAPEGVEGRWLMRYLEQRRIPFFAFRTSVPGQATAPHIHIGPPSTRIRPSD